MFACCETPLFSFFFSFWGAVVALVVWWCVLCFPGFRVSSLSVCVCVGDSHKCLFFWLGVSAPVLSSDTPVSLSICFFPINWPWVNGVFIVCFRQVKLCLLLWVANLCVLKVAGNPKLFPGVKSKADDVCFSFCPTANHACKASWATKELHIKQALVIFYLTWEAAIHFYSLYWQKYVILNCQDKMVRNSHSNSHWFVSAQTLKNPWSSQCQSCWINNLYLNTFALHGLC